VSEEGLGVPVGPVEAPPRGFVPAAGLAEILAGALAGVELGAWDRRVAAWLAGLDAPTVLTIASWVARSRAAETAR
jgi:hypothetical protein